MNTTQNFAELQICKTIWYKIYILLYNKDFRSDIIYEELVLLPKWAHFCWKVHFSMSSVRQVHNPKFLQFPKASPFFAGSCTPVACPAHSTGNNIPGGCDCLAGAMVEWVEKLLTIVTDFPPKEHPVKWVLSFWLRILDYHRFSVFPSWWSSTFLNFGQKPGLTNLNNFVIETAIHSLAIISSSQNIPARGSYYLTTSRCETPFVF